jgi:hypothetical protein
MPESPFDVSTLHSYAHLLDKECAYRLAVISPTASGVVEAAGSWLFDRAKGGWRIGLFVIDPVESADAAALRILGVDKVEPLSALKPTDIESASAIAVDSTTLDGAPMLAKRLHALALRRATEILMWGPAPAHWAELCEVVRYLNPSTASRAFKARALTVSGSTAGDDGTAETFHRVTAVSLRYGSDLLAADSTTAASPGSRANP